MKLNIAMSQDSTSPLTLYDSARKAVISSGYSDEVQWQRDLLKDDFDIQDLMKEAAWVILCSGFNEKVVRKKFSYISLCFYDWESSVKISENRSLCIQTAAHGFSNVAKLSAIASVADILNEIGFKDFKDKVKKDPFSTLQLFPFIGPVTSIHLAKNLGVDCVKPDVHMVRLAELYKFKSPLHLCRKIADHTGDSLAVIDIILWRYCTLNRQYMNA